MSFNEANLTPKIYLSGGSQQASKVWDYSTGDNLATVEGSTYFDSAVKNLRQDDIVRVTANDGNALYVVDGMSLSGGGDGAVVKLAVVDSFPSL